MRIHADVIYSSLALKKLRPSMYSLSKPSCSFCGKQFTKEIGRVDHQIRIHVDDSFYGKFPCEFCTRKCRRKVDLEKHLENPGKRHLRKGNFNQL